VVVVADDDEEPEDDLGTWRRAAGQQRRPRAAQSSLRGRQRERDCERERGFTTTKRGTLATQPEPKQGRLPPARTGKVTVDFTSP
jgi:hypothetical protein